MTLRHPLSTLTFVFVVSGPDSVGLAAGQRFAGASLAAATAAGDRAPIEVCGRRATGHAARNGTMHTGAAAADGTRMPNTGRGTSTLPRPLPIFNQEAVCPLENAGTSASFQTTAD